MYYPPLHSDHILADRTFTENITTSSLQILANLGPFKTSFIIFCHVTGSLMRPKSIILNMKVMKVLIKALFLHFPFKRIFQEPVSCSINLKYLQPFKSSSIYSIFGSKIGWVSFVGLFVVIVRKTDFLHISLV